MIFHSLFFANFDFSDRLLQAGTFTLIGKQPKSVFVQRLFLLTPAGIMFF